MSDPAILSFAGLDPIAGAGLAVDTLMITRCGGSPRSVVTCLTVQNRHGFQSADPVDPGQIKAAFLAVLEDGPLHAVKVGLLPDVATLEIVSRLIVDHVSHLPIVVDPVLSATAGGMKARRELLAGYQAMMPLINLLTPNTDELARLSGGGGAAKILDMGAAAVLATGAEQRMGEQRQIVDVLTTGQGVWRFAHPHVPCGPVHGTGCALSAAIATGLAHDVDLQTACQGAIQEVARCLEKIEPTEEGLPQNLKI